MQHHFCVVECSFVWGQGLEIGMFDPGESSEKREAHQRGLEARGDRVHYEGSLSKGRKHGCEDASDAKANYPNPHGLLGVPRTGR